MGGRHLQGKQELDSSEASYAHRIYLWELPGGWLLPVPTLSFTLCPPTLLAHFLRAPMSHAASDPLLLHAKGHRGHPNIISGEIPATRPLSCWCKFPAQIHPSSPPGTAPGPTGQRALGHHVAAERDVGRAARLERDGVRVEVAQHVEDGLEPEVLHVALPALVQRQAEVLRGQGQG